MRILAPGKGPNRPWHVALRVVAALGTVCLGAALAVVIVEFSAAVAPGVFPSFMRLPTVNPLALLVFDDTLGYRLRGGVDVQIEGEDYVFRWQTSADGWRAPDAPPSADRPCAIAVGDSFTFGYGVESWQAWPAVLGRTLGCAVVNLGVDGYGPQSEALVVERFAPHYHPRLVLLGFAANDLLEAELFGRCGEAYGSGTMAFAACVVARAGGAHWSVPLLARLAPYWPAVGPVVAGSVTLRLARQLRFQQLGLVAREVPVGRDGEQMTLSSYWWRQPHWRGESVSRQVSEFRQAITQAKAAADRTAATLVAILLPYREQVYWRLVREVLDPPADFDPDGARWIALREFAAAGVPVVDLTDVMCGEAQDGVKLYFARDGHWTAEGHERAARAVAQELRARGLAPVAE